MPAGGGKDIAYYTLPVMLSFEGAEKQINAAIGGKKIGVKAGKDVASGVSDGIKAGQNDVKKALDGYAKLYDKAADQADKLKVAQAGIADLEAKGITSGQRYERALATKEKALRDQNRVLREAKGAYEDYERAAKDAAKAADRVSEGGGGGLLERLKGSASGAASAGGEAASGFVEGFGGPIAALGARGGPIGLALAAAAVVATGAGALIATNVMAGMEREVASDRIAAQLGLTPAESASFGRSAGEVYANNFGESIGDVAEAQAAVASTFGKSIPTDALEDLTSKALAFRDVFGTEVPEAAAFAQNLIVNGLAPNAQSAFDLMTTAYQRVPAAMRDELPEILNEYSTYFQSLGFSGEEAFGLIVKNAPRGKIAIDKMGDSLKEFGIRATDLGDKGAFGALTETLKLDAGAVANNLLAGGDQAQAQFDQIIDGLLGIPDAGEQAAAALALFGTPLEDLDKAKIPEFLQGLDNAEASMTGFAGSTETLVATAGDNAAGSVESAKRAIENAAGGMQDVLAEAFGPGIEQFAGFIVAHKDEITGFFLTAANAGAEFGSAVLGSAAGILQAVGQIANGVSGMASFVIDKFSGLVGAAASVADALGMDGFAADLRGAQSDLRGFAEDIKGAGDPVIDLSNGLFNAAVKLHDFDANALAAAGKVEGLGQAINVLPDGSFTLTDNTPEAIANIDRTKFRIEEIPGTKDFKVVPITAEATSTVDRWVASQTNKVAEVNLGANLDKATVDVQNWANKLAIGGGISVPVRAAPAGAPFVGAGVGIAAPRARGGVLPGYSPGVDNMLVPMSGGEGVLIPEAVRGLGGAPAIHAINSQFRSGLGGYANGGVVGLDALYSKAQSYMGTPYSMPNRTDCSGTIARFVNAALGLPDTSLMSTANAAPWLAERGATPGMGPAGTFRIGWKNGGPGGGHMAATLPDGTNVEMGGANGGYAYGGNAKGADAPDFTDFAYFPVEALYPDGKPTGSVAASLGYTSASGGGYGGAGGAGGSGMAGVGPNGEAGSYTVDPADVAAAEGKVRESDAKVLEAEAKKRELEADAKESEKIARDNDVAKAKEDARQARVDLAEAQKGKFSASKGGGAGGGKAGGMGQFGELGSIAGSFLKETLGIDGSFLPDISSLMPLQMAETLLSSFLPGALGGGQTTSTSGGAFGMDVPAPPMPPAGVHTGSGGLPGPAGGAPITIDQSINGNVGWNPDEVMRRRNEGLARAVPRMKP